ncbi:MAG: peroxiredoxin [Bdellovibrionia bacterium]
MKKLIQLLGLFGLMTTLLAMKVGDPVPDFSLPNQDGKVVKLSSFQGKPVLLFFYPKDQTPGCTKEACSFRDEYSKFKKLGAVVLGISKQDSKEHQKFIEKHKLPFDLLVDNDGAVAKSFGVGTIPIIGLLKRKSVLIGPDGKLVRFYDDVDPNTHTSEVLKDLENLKGQT